MFDNMVFISRILLVFRPQRSNIHLAGSSKIYKTAMITRVSYCTLQFVHISNKNHTCSFNIRTFW